MKNKLIALYKKLKNHGASILAISAILLASWEGLENRKHNRLSVFPKLDSYPSIDTNELKKTYSLNLYSSGLGPVVIKKVYAWYDNQLVYPNKDVLLWEVIREKLVAKNFFMEQSYEVNSGEFIPAGNNRRVLTISAPTNSNLSKQLQVETDKIGVLICYCSIYDDNCSSLQIGRVSHPQNCS
ncbi:MAG: hypothetical protein ACPGJI_01445 [Kangiellaceae bacterium]